MQNLKFNQTLAYERGRLYTRSTWCKGSGEDAILFNSSILNMGQPFKFMLLSTVSSTSLMSVLGRIRSVRLNGNRSAFVFGNAYVY